MKRYLVPLLFLFSVSCTKGGDVKAPANTHNDVPVAVDSNKLTRAAALSLISKDIGVLRGYVLCAVVVDTGFSGELLEGSKGQAVLVQKGYATMAPLGNMLRQYYVTPTSKGAALMPLNKTAYGDKLAIPIAFPKLLEITGILQNGTEAKVEFTYQWDINNSLKDLDGTFVVKNIKRTIQTGTTVVRLYDDGWRVVPDPNEVREGGIVKVNLDESCGFS
jgi:hypothetical protein